MKNKKTLPIIVGILVIVITVVGGVSFAVWQLTKTQTGTNIVNSGCFKIIMEGKDDINLQNAYPLSGGAEFNQFLSSAVPYHFTIENVCDTRAKTVINLETLPVEGKVLKDEYVGAVLLEGSKSYKEHMDFVKTLSTEEEQAQYTIQSQYFFSTLTPDIINENKIIEEALKAYQLYDFILEPNEKKEFNLYLFMNSNTPVQPEVMNANWQGKITVASAYMDKNGPLNYMRSTHDEEGNSVNSLFRNNSDIRSNVTKIIIQNKKYPTNVLKTYTDIEDESASGDESIISFVLRNTDGYTLYIQANGRISLPQDSSRLFESFSKVTTMEGMEYLDTSNVTDMRYMFSDMNSLTNLDISSFDTSNVTNMSYMFFRNNAVGSMNYGSKFVRKEGSNITCMLGPNPNLEYAPKGSTWTDLEQLNNCEM